MNYPDYVKKYKPKGTIVKKMKDTFYVYYATSKRVPDKSYPVQVITGLAGKIDENGFHTLTTAKVNTEHVLIREYGFTNYLLKFEEEYISRRSEPKQQKKNLYRSMIVYLSSNSYLNEDPSTHIYTPEEMIELFHIGLPNQITAISKICEINLKELEPLKYICCVKMGHRVFYSDISKAQKEILSKLWVTENYLR